MSALPNRLHDLVRAAIDNGWTVVAVPQEDTGGSPFITVRLKRDHHDIHATWHTRETGTYRWAGAVVDNRSTGVPYTRVRDLIEEDPA